MRNYTFFQRIVAFQPPKTLSEGLLKGLAIGAFMTSILLEFNFLELKPETSARVLRFYLGLMLLFGAWGLYNQQNEPEIQNRNR